MCESYAADSTVKTMARFNHSTLTLSLTLSLVLLVALLFPLRAAAAVTVTSFTASWQGTQVSLNWRTATELNNRGFNLFRSTSPSGAFQKINGTEIPAQMGAALIGASYAYVDSSVTAGQTYYYKLQSVENNGTTIFYEGIASTAPQTQATATRTPTRTATKPPATATLTPQSTATRTPTLVGSPTPLMATPTGTITAAPKVALADATPTPLRTKVAFVPTAPAPPSANDEQTSVAEPTATPPQVAIAIKESAPDETSEPETTESDLPAQSDGRAQQLMRASITIVSGLIGLGGLLFALGAAYFFARTYLR